MQIKKVMMAHGESWASVAKKMGKTPSAIIQVADGNPTVGKLKALAEQIGCHWLDFFEDELQAEGLRIVAAPSSSAGSESSSAGSERSAGSEGQSPSEGQEREQGAEGLPFGNGEKEHTAHRPTALGMYACPYCGRGVTIEVKGV